MKTADRILANGLVPPYDLRSIGEHTLDWKADAAHVIKTLGSCPILVADNVAAFTRTQDHYVLEEFPCLAPPWPEFWLEYPSVSGKQRRGIFVRDVTGTRRSIEGATEMSIKDARENGFVGEPRWVIELGAFVEEERHRILGPVGWMILALDDRGMVVGNRWVMGVPFGAGDRARLHTGSDFNDGWLLSALLPALQAIAFLHCRNITIDTVVPPAKLSARHKRLHGRPLLRHQQVRLEVPRASGSPHGAGSGQMGPPSLHIVAGHFAHYGDCHPPREGCRAVHVFNPCQLCGGHKPHGLLFGKHQGVYWSSQTVRGNPERGQVRTDRELVVRDA